MKNKDKLFEGLEQSSSDAKKVVIMNKRTKLLLNGFVFKEAKMFRLMAQYSNKRRINF